MTNKTLAPYNTKTTELVEYFRGIGTRVGDIERALGLTGKVHRSEKYQ